MPILTTIPHSELPDLGSPASNELSAGILQSASLAKMMTDSRGRQSRLEELSGPGTRALCSGCSCDADNGCLYNCDKCGSLCLSCDCSSSQACKYNCDKCEKEEEKAENIPSVSPVVSEADQFLSNLNNQFRPEASIGIVPPSNHWRPEPETQPVEAEAETEYEIDYDDTSFSWLDFDPKATSCVADGGPAAGKMCNFPFKHQGKTYYECAPLEGNMLELKETGIHGWCSSHRDVNGLHIRGPYAEPWRNVGLCGSGCRIDIKK